jgi:hypothetical protein
MGMKEVFGRIFRLVTVVTMNFHKADGNLQAPSLTDNIIERRLKFLSEKVLTEA